MPAIDLQPCPWAMVQRVDEHQLLHGPVFVDGGHITLEVTPNMKIKGEWIMTVCASQNGARIVITSTSP